QPCANGCNLLLQTRTAGQKWRQQLIHASLKLLRRFGTETEKITQNGAEDQQRDEVGATHSHCNWETQKFFRRSRACLAGAICPRPGRLITLLPDAPAAFRRAQFPLAPLAVCRCD